MPEKTKILLSAVEQDLLENSEWILTKEQVIQKTYLLFADAAAGLKRLLHEFSNNIVSECGNGVPKISRGENYLGLPWVMMDFPACFGKEDIFAMRTMLWWGKNISIHLLLKGNYKTAFEQQLINELTQIPAGIFICVGASEWDHHFEPGNYLPANLLVGADLQLLRQKAFIKVALKYNLNQWNEMETILQTGYSRLLNLLQL